MFNLLISLLSGTVVGTLTGFLLGLPVAGVIPGLLVFGICFFFIAKRIGNMVTAEMNLLVPMLQARKIKEAETHLLGMRRRYGRWQFMLAGQMDAQRGMIRYMHTEFDDAMPLLQAGKFRNWAALVSIGCIHFRRDRKDEAWKAFEKASTAASKEPMVYVVWAILLTRDGKRPRALEVMSRAQKAIPDNAILTSLLDSIANRKKINTSKLPESWFQFFPEELRAQMVKGRRGGPPANVQYREAPFPQPNKSSKKMRRGG